MRSVVAAILVTLVFYGASRELHRTLQAAVLWVYEKTGNLYAMAASVVAVSTVILLVGLFVAPMPQSPPRLPVAFAMFIGGSLDIGVAAFLIGRNRPRLQEWLSTAAALAMTLLLALLTIWSGLATI
jgi:hypothetical protein